MSTAAQPPRSGPGSATAQAQPDGSAAAAIPPAPGPSSSSTPATSADSWSSTPRLLRGLRVAGAAAALLTGIAATGTFSTDGLNATPNVIASQWTAAEQAGVDIAEADLLAVTRVAAEDPSEPVGDYDELVAQTGRDLGRMGDSSGEAASDWSVFVVGAERASAAAATEDDSSATAGYEAASASARSAVASTDQIASQHVDDLLTGSRSMLTAIVGTLGTLVLGAIMVRLALQTRRILNVPLLLATLVTGGLTYLSINPAALPLDYDQRVTQSSDTAAALQDVYQARTAQQAQAIGAAADWDTAAASATEAIDELEDPLLSDTWALVADSGAEPDLVEASQADFDLVEQDLTGMFSERVERVTTEVSAPAVLTSGAALLLGLVGAALAWTGITQRLRDYR